MKGLEMVKCESLRMNMYRITQTGKSMNFPVTTSDDEAVGRGTNDFTRIGTFEIISRHCYLFI